MRRLHHSSRLGKLFYGGIVLVVVFGAGMLGFMKFASGDSVSSTTIGGIGGVSNNPCTTTGPVNGCYETRCSHSYAILISCPGYSCVTNSATNDIANSCQQNCDVNLDPNCMTYSACSASCLNSGRPGVGSGATSSSIPTIPIRTRTPSTLTTSTTGVTTPPSTSTIGSGSSSTIIDSSTITTGNGTLSTTTSSSSITSTTTQPFSCGSFEFACSNLDGSQTCCVYGCDAVNGGCAGNPSNPSNPITQPSSTQNQSQADYLSPSISANPYSGIAPLATGIDAKAQTTNAGAGTFNYSVFRDCSYTGSDLAGAEAACGQLPAPSNGRCVQNSVGAKCDGVSTYDEFFYWTYTNPGTYHPFMLLEQGSLAPASASTLITVLKDLNNSKNGQNNNGGNGGGGGSNGNPSISCTMSASPTQVTAGSSVKISWNCTSVPPSETCTLAGQSVNPNSGSITVKPTQSTQYILSCTAPGNTGGNSGNNGGTTTQAGVMVSVSQNPGLREIAP